MATPVTIVGGPSRMSKPHFDVLLVELRDRRVHLRLAEAALVVEHADAKDVASQLLAVEVLPILDRRHRLNLQMRESRALLQLVAVV
jgi:hypothetical protein